MTRLIVAISTVADGNMYIPTDKADLEVTANRERFLAQQGITMEQATRLDVLFESDDYCRYLDVGPANMGQGMRGDDVASGDALVTTTVGHALFLPVADCTATVIYDPVRRVLMLSHLGRHSVVQDGAVRSVRYLAETYGSDPKDLRIWLSPSPGKDAYPLWDLGNRGFKEIIWEQLQAAGVLAAQVTDNAVETDKDPAYFSHSEFLAGRQATDGRYAMVAMMTA